MAKNMKKENETDTTKSVEFEEVYKFMMCPYCDKEHLVEAISDSGHVVAWKCPTENRVIKTQSNIWKGEDISKPINSFVDRLTDEEVINKLYGDKLFKLAKKFAYMFIQARNARAEREGKGTKYYSYPYIVFLIERRLTDRRSGVKAEENRK